MSVINTNVSSLNAASALAINERNLSTSMERLSTGKRINGAKDDAAGLAIAAKMILNGTLTEKGVTLPVNKDVYEPILAELETFNIRFDETELEMKK